MSTLESPIEESWVLGSSKKEPAQIFLFWVAVRAAHAKSELTAHKLASRFPTLEVIVTIGGYKRPKLVDGKELPIIL